MSRMPALRRVGHNAPFRVPIRHREYLAGSAHDAFPESIPDIGDMIPTLAVDQAGSPQPALAEALREAIEQTLPEYGGVLLRGLPLAGKADFERLVTDIGYEPVGYRGGIAVRKQDSGVALNASQEDPRITLSPHNEMAYLPGYPRKIFFFCDTQAPYGGEVPINDIRRTVDLIPGPLLTAFRERGIRYHRSLPRESSAGEMGWTETFGTRDKALVAEYLTAAGHQYRWDTGDRLRYHYRRDAFVTHPETGEQLWFNQVTELHCSYWRAHPDFAGDLPDDEYPATTTYGDGAQFGEEQIAYLRGLLWQTTRAVRMRRGDVLVLDNQVLQHGRLAYQGPRRHFVSLTR